MERLTDVDKVGAYLLKCRQEPCKDLKGNCKSCSHMQQALEKLAEYEVLGVTPEQIKEMDALFQKKCEEVSKLEKENKTIKVLVKITKGIMEKLWGNI